MGATCVVGDARITCCCEDARQAQQVEVYKHPQSVADFFVMRDNESLKIHAGTPKHVRSDEQLAGVREEGMDDVEGRLARCLERWSRVAGREVPNFSEATMFMTLDISYNEALKGCTISPEHYVITFNNCHQSWLRPQSALFSCRVVKQSDLPATVPVGGKVENKQGNTAILQGEYIEFELLSELTDNLPELPLKICSGPSRLNPHTMMKEYLGVDLGRCLRDGTSCVVDDPSAGASGGRLLRTRWYVCIELLRFVCDSNHIPCDSLSVPSETPLHWVLCLISGGAASGSTSLKTSDLTSLSSSTSGQSQSSAWLEPRTPEQKTVSFYLDPERF
eukprot:TRINITY_DN37671_c0_g1_i1.p1 TRINITY_DN37671_c0_g1~~TRINITY_DN37671_c0_g1_i1.p1  ORF type:complete len:334 (-),score=56.17 TRINITY_DN37671_c0_g1_i1:24-1025(-)